MTTVPLPICYSCVHLSYGPDMTCAAYPSGIPLSIIESRADHRQSYPGDHGITFTQDPEAPELDFSMYRFPKQAVTAAVWNPDLHPRGRDGKFIEKLGFVELFGVPEHEDGTRGQVKDIVPNPDRPGDPDIVVTVNGKDVTTRANNLNEGAQTKARLDGAEAPETPEAEAPEAPEAPETEDSTAKARSLLEAAAAVEPDITAKLQEIASTRDAELVGLQNRLKTEESLARKIDANEPGYEIKDALRYTMEVPTDKYGDATKATLASLQTEGWDVDTKTYWQEGDPYQGINVVLRKDGVVMELQFHTPESMEAKHQIHPLYEKFRVSTDNAERRRLYEEMVKIADDIPVPKGIDGLPNERSVFQPYEDVEPLQTTLLPRGAEARGRKLAKARGS